MRYGNAFISILQIEAKEQREEVTYSRSHKILTAMVNSAFGARFPSSKATIWLNFPAIFSSRRKETNKQTNTQIKKWRLCSDRAIVLNQLLDTWNAGQNITAETLINILKLAQYRCTLKAPIFSKQTLQDCTHRCCKTKGLTDVPSFLPIHLSTVQHLHRECAAS